MFIYLSTLNSLEKLLITETVTVQALYYAMKHLL